MDKKFILALVIMAATLLACGRGCGDRHDRDDRSERREKNDDNSSYKNEDDDYNDEGKKKIMYDTPFFPSNSDYGFIPVRLVDENDDIFYRLKKEFNKLDYSSTGTRFDYDDLYNMIFYNKLTGEARPLLNANIYISKIFIPEYDTTKADSLRIVLFATVEKDFNNDKDIDNDDGETVFITDYTGRIIRQVSPDGVKLLSWELDSESGMLYLTINTDSNADKKFNSKDEIKILRTSISNPVVGTDIIPDSLKTQLNNIYR